MASNTEQLQTAKRAIAEAFAGVECPPDEQLLHPGCQDACQVEPFKAARWRSWDEVPCELIEENYFVLPFFSPEAFRFFLPAFMICSLDEVNGTLALFTAFGVKPPSTYNPTAEEIQMVHYRSQIGILTAAQRQAVAFFLACADPDSQSNSD